MGRLRRHLLYGLVLVASTASPWGAMGHRLVAQKAESLLSPASHRWLAQCFHHTIALSSISSWADEVRSRFPRTVPNHFATLPSPEATFVPSSKHGRLPEALERAWQLGQQPSTCQLGVAWMVHLVGDAHQPLHVGNGRDRGGNRCWVLPSARSRRPTRLHGYWDRWVLTHRSIKFWASMQPSTKVAPPQRYNVETFQAWCRQSRGLHPTVYWDPGTQRRLACVPRGGHQHPRLSLAYRHTAERTIRAQLDLAGTRLAQVIEAWAKLTPGISNPPVGDGVF